MIFYWLSQPWLHFFCVFIICLFVVVVVVFLLVCFLFVFRGFFLFCFLDDIPVLFKKMKRTFYRGYNSFCSVFPTKILI